MIITLDELLLPIYCTATESLIIEVFNQHEDSDTKVPLFSKAPYLKSEGICFDTSYTLYDWGVMRHVSNGEETLDVPLPYYFDDATIYSIRADIKNYFLELTKGRNSESEFTTPKLDKVNNLHQRLLGRVYQLTIPAIEAKTLDELHYVYINILHRALGLCGSIQAPTIYFSIEGHTIRVNYTTAETQNCLHYVCDWFNNAILLRRFHESVSTLYPKKQVSILHTNSKIYHNYLLPDPTLPISQYETALQNFVIGRFNESL